VPAWARSLAPWAEKVAHILGRAMDGKYQLATPLTSSRAKAAQAVVKARKIEASQRATRSTPRQRPAAEPAVLPLWSCPDCGGSVTNPRDVRCDSCIATDPAQAAEVRGRRGAAIAARKRALSEWDRANPGAIYDPELFARDIPPRLATVKLSAIVDATGMSKAFASQVRAGKFTPHVSTWAALAELVGVDLGDVTALQRRRARQGDRLRSSQARTWGVESLRPSREPRQSTSRLRLSRTH
jgi:hypothetical protein